MIEWKSLAGIIFESDPENLQRFVFLVRIMNEIECKRLSILSTVQNGLPEIRKGLGLSQTDFAKIMCKTRQTISLIERKELDLTWETCLAIVTVASVRKPRLLTRLYRPDRDTG